MAQPRAVLDKVAPQTPPSTATERQPARSPVARLFALASHPSVAASAAFLLSGTAFALGNLLLARALPIMAFGHFALALALFNIFVLIAPMGLDQFVLRHHAHPDGRFFTMILGFSLAMGGAVSAFVVSIGGLTGGEGWALTVAIASGSVIVAANAALRSTARNGWGLIFSTGASWLLLAIGGATLLWRPGGAVEPLAIFALGNVLLAVMAVVLALGQRPADSPKLSIDWREASSLLGIAAVGTMALQVERLLVPGRLGLEDLATYSVLASTAIFPFRLLVAGVGFSLVPRLRRAKDAREKRSIVKLELLAAGGLALLAAMAILILTPVVVPWLTSGTYAVGYGLTAVACLNGLSKLSHAMATAIITGCGGKAAVRHLNRLSFLWLGLVCAGGWAGANLGFVGLLIGVSLGGLAISVPTAILAYRSIAR